MKQVFLVRHAKSSWSDPRLPDIDRPLNKRGYRDAPVMADFISEKYPTPDLMLSSPANRARTTADFFADRYNSIESVRIIDALYHASSSEILHCISTLQDDVNRAFIFAHNPALTYIADRYAATHIPNVPTCGIIILSSQESKWSNFEFSNPAVSAFHYPKQLL